MSLTLYVNWRSYFPYIIKANFIIIFKRYPSVFKKGNLCPWLFYKHDDHDDGSGCDNDDDDDGNDDDGDDDDTYVYPNVHW